MFKHETLDTSKPQIRLIHLVQEEDGTVSFRVQFHDFDENLPLYNALSYIWGPPLPTREILLNKRASWSARISIGFSSTCKEGDGLMSLIKLRFLYEISPYPQCFCGWIKYALINRSYSKGPKVCRALDLDYLKLEITLLILYIILLKLYSIFIRV
jgi:hypothetical protein